MPDDHYQDGKSFSTKISTNLLRYLVKYKLDSSEWSIVMLVITSTWTFFSDKQKKVRKTWTKLEWKKILEETNLANGVAGYAIAKLKARNILHTKSVGRHTQYKINSHFTTWIDAKDIPREAYRKRPSLHPGGVKSSLHPGGASNSTQVEQLLHPGGVVPIKKNILNESFKHKGENVCVLTPKHEIKETAKIVLDCLNELSGKEFSYADENLDPIIERLASGATVEQCMKVCFNKWQDDTFHNQFYRPSTLFKKTLFEGYLNSEGAKFKPATKQEAKRYHNAQVLYEREIERRLCEQHGKRAKD